MELLMVILKAIIAVVLSVVLPILTAVLKSFLQTWINKCKNDKIKEILFDATEIMEDAVNFTSQTFVDELKKQGAFTDEAKADAAKRAAERTYELMTQEMKDTITANYGDLEKYVETKIESIVKHNH